MIFSYLFLRKNKTQHSRSNKLEWFEKRIFNMKLETYLKKTCKMILKLTKLIILESKENLLFIGQKN